VILVLTGLSVSSAETAVRELGFLKLPARKQQRTAFKILIWDQGPESPLQAGSPSEREAEHAGTDIEDGEVDLPMNYPALGAALCPKLDGEGCKWVDRM
jgi:hypothetical protein